MEFGERGLLQKIVENVEENNKILRRLQRDLRWRRFFGFLKWVVIIALSAGAYYYLQPWLEQTIATYQGIWEQIGQIQNSLPFVGQ